MGVTILKEKLNYGQYDNVDAFGLHGVAGVLGSILTGVFATKTVNVEGSGCLDGMDQCYK